MALQLVRGQEFYSIGISRWTGIRMGQRWRELSGAVRAFGGFLGLAVMVACGGEEVLAPLEAERRTDPEVSRLLEEVGTEGAVLIMRISAGPGVYTLKATRGNKSAAIRKGWAARAGARRVSPSQVPADRPLASLDFLMEPELGNQKPGAQDTFRYGAAIRCNGLPVAFHVDSMKQTRLAQTGGHRTEPGGHPEPFPLGTFEKTSGPSMFDGFEHVWESTYEADSLSGDEDNFIWITVNDPFLTSCNGVRLSGMMKGAVRIYDELVHIDEGPHLYHQGITSHHFDVSWASPNVRDTTLVAAEAFFRNNQQLKLRLNAASLIYGGKNDVNGQWRDDEHELHRLGLDVDLDAGSGLPWDSDDWFDKIKTAGREAGFRSCAPHVGQSGREDHVHCKGR